VTKAQSSAAGTADWLRSVWKGRQPLAVTYWLVGVAGNMGWLALLIVLYVLMAPAALLWLVYLLSLAWFVLVFVSVNRAARAYPGPDIWPLLARAGVWIGVVRMWAEAVLLIVLAGGTR
jgi:hypothetical protein